jgi:hypothetical protein
MNRICILLTTKTLLGIPWLLLLAAAGCRTLTEDITLSAYVRVMDMRSPQYGEPILHSVFRWDGHPYGNPALDTVRSPQLNLNLFGDFLLGRTTGLYSNDSIFTGLLDYGGFQPDDSEAVLFQPYHQGASFAQGRFVYFPNLTHRIPLAPIVNGIDYYKWANLGAGQHTVGFAKVSSQVESRRSVKRFRDRPFLTDAPYYFQPSGIYSFLLVSEQSDDPERVRLIRIQEDEQLAPQAGKAYIRFINAIPLTGEPQQDAATESVDVYVRQLDNAELNQLFTDTLSYDIRYLASASPERLVARDLTRFGADGKVPYFEMDLSTYLSREDTTARSVTTQGVPSFIFFVYPQGQSQATGAAPMAQYRYPLSNIAQSPPFSLDKLPIRIPVLARTANGFVTTIQTIILGTEILTFRNGLVGMGYSLEQSSVRQAYLDRYNRGGK